MGHYTKFHFRAKLIFDLPLPVRLTLRHQFLQVNSIDWSDPSRPNHPFFQLPRAHMIPWAWQSDDFIKPSHRDYPDGSSILEFTCEFKNYDDEIEQFLDWIRPYVRLRYGKRLRGRDKVWVGWFRSESAGDRSNVFIKPAPRPGVFEGNLYDREVVINWHS